MSETKANPTSAEPTQATAAPTDKAAAPANQLTDLMAGGEKGKAQPANERVAPDLEAEALRAAEAALTEGQRALAAARQQLAGQPAAPDRAARRRELALRALLLANVLAMVVVASLPSPAPRPATGPASAAPPAAAPAPAPAAPAAAEPWNRAMEASNRGDWAAAIAILEQSLADTPRMAPSQQLNVLMALSYYSSRLGKVKEAQDYQRRADALEKSHSLPEDLVAEAKAAAANGDQESLRRIWARFLLQQRQIPSWLYQHVAAAYLQLGDSYRLQANAAAEAARLQELEATAARLRAQAADRVEERK